MKRLLGILGFVCGLAHAQVNPGFVSGQVLTAGNLNYAFSLATAVQSGSLVNPTVTGSFTATGLVTTTDLASQAANTVLANVTAGMASPTAVALPSCSTVNSALQYASGTGLVCGTSFALTSGTLGQFAATTSAQLAGVVSDETGSGALVFGTAPTISNLNATGTPTAPTATAGTNTTQLATTAFAQTAVTGGGNAGSFTTLTAAGLITPSSTIGIKGTTTNDSAQVGSIGEYITSTQSSAVPLTTGTAANITSISVTAGDWDVQGVICFTPASGTTVTNMTAGTSTTSATLDVLGTYAGLSIPYTGNGGGSCITSPRRQIKVTTTTTVYLVALQAFGTSTMTGTGTITARRPR